MSNLTGDDYWKQSSLGKFSFDDEVQDDIKDEENEGSADGNSDSLFYTTLHNYNSLPIHSIISKKGLDHILQDIKLPVKSNLSTEETVKKLFLGITCYLDSYRSLQQKIELLDKACETSDGNVILKVVLFLRRTLNDSTFYYYLSKQKVALTQYSIYLVQQNKFSDLHSLYMSVGSTNDLINIFYLPAKNYTSSKKKRDEIENFFSCLGTTISQFNKTTLINYQNFLDILIKKNLTLETPIEYLIYLYQNYLENNASKQDITAFCTFLKIENFQQQWHELNILAYAKMWEKLLQTFVKPNVFLRKLRCEIDIDVIVLTLHKHEAPKNVLQQFLQCIGDSEKGLYLGRKFQCHKYVIEKLIDNKDRLGLIEYKRMVAPQSEDFFFIDKALCSDKKWKN